MEEAANIKPYILHLNNQLKTLEPQIKKLTSQPFNDQLLSLSNGFERLLLSNKYAYVLSSLLFVYMKVLNFKDLSPIMDELGRVKYYMDRVKQLQSRDQAQEKLEKEKEVQVKSVINSSLGLTCSPSISKVHFEGKHTKFEDSSDQHAMAVMSRLKQVASKPKTVKKVTKKRK